MFWGIPSFIWDRIFDVFQVLFAAGFVAWFSSVILRKRDEITKVKGFQLERRLKAYEQINEMLSTAYSRQYEPNPEKLIKFFGIMGLEPIHESLQCSDIFRDNEAYQKFYDMLRRTASTTRLYLDLRVRDCLIAWENYFYWINMILDAVDKTPFKSKYSLSEIQKAKKKEKLLHLLGVLLDEDLISLHGKTEEAITNQLYRLRLEDGRLFRWKHRKISLGLQAAMSRIVQRMETSRFTWVHSLKDILTVFTFPPLLRSKRLCWERSQISLLVTQVVIEEHLGGRLIPEMEWPEVVKIFDKLWTEGWRT